VTPLRTRGARSLGSRGSGAPAPINHRSTNQDRQRRSVERLAEAIFAERGYRDTTIRLVAARAKCSVGQIYKLYPNKLELYRGILESRIECLTALVDGIVDGPENACERLDRCVRAVLEFFQANSGFFLIYAQETGGRLWAGGKGLSRGKLFAMRQHALDRVIELVHEGQRRGELRADLDAASATISLFGMIKGQAGERMWRREERTLAQEAGGIVELFFRGMSTPEGEGRRAATATPGAGAKGVRRSGTRAGRSGTEASRSGTGAGRSATVASRSGTGAGRRNGATPGRKGAGRGDR